VLTVNMTLDPVTGGGSAVRTLEITKSMARLGAECAIATSSIGDLEPSALERIPLITMPALGGRFRVPWRGFSAVRQAVEHADTVLLVNHWTLINVVAWRCIQRAGKPYIVCPAGALPGRGRSLALKRIYNGAFGRDIIRQASGHVAITTDEIDHYAEYGVAAEDVAVIPNGVSALRPGRADRFRQEHRLGTSPFFLFLGRLAHIKGPDLLIDAFARFAPRHPDWQLVLAGADDGALSDLRRRTEAAGMTARVTMTGFLDAQNKADALAAADLLVVPSRREAMSIVVLEAAAAGRAVLVTDRCGIPEVEASGGGWAVPASVSGLEQGLAEAARARASLPAMGGRWKCRASELFSWDRAAEQHLALMRAAERRSRTA
jgi:glycosyltransferase involved in cell wall biosynthesis